MNRALLKDAVDVRQSAPPSGSIFIMKRCSNCELEKPRSQYYVRRASPDGLSYICKSCTCQNSSLWAKNNREKCNANGRKRYWKDVKRSRAMDREKHARQFLENPEKARARWRKSNAKDGAARSALWAKRHPDQARAIHNRVSRDWASKNRQHLGDWYIRNNLKKGGIIKSEDIPQAMVEAKRALIQIRRIEREHRNKG